MKTHSINETYLTTDSTARRFASDDQWRELGKLEYNAFSRQYKNKGWNTIALEKLDRHAAKMGLKRRQVQIIG